jgi:hypothetical protein
VRNWCGPASGVLKIGDERLAIGTGECSTGETWFAVNLGSVVSGSGREGWREATAERPQVVLNVGDFPGTDDEPAEDDGTYERSVATIVYDGERYFGRGTVTLTGGRTAGTFTFELERTPLSGEFSCQ